MPVRTKPPSYSFSSTLIGNLMELFWNTCFQSATRFCSRNLYNHAIAQTVSRFTICFSISNVFKHSSFPPFPVYISQLCPGLSFRVLIHCYDSWIICDSLPVQSQLCTGSLSWACFYTLHINTASSSPWNSSLLARFSTAISGLVLWLCYLSSTSL